MKLLCLQYDFIWKSKGLYPFSGDPFIISYYQIHHPLHHIDLASTFLLSRLVYTLLYIPSYHGIIPDMIFDVIFFYFKDCLSLFSIQWSFTIFILQRSIQNGLEFLLLFCRSVCLLTQVFSQASCACSVHSKTLNQWWIWLILGVRLESLSIVPHSDPCIIDSF